MTRASMTQPVEDEAGYVRRKGRKYDQVVEGALKVFMADGYEGASVDDIAREAQVSKATLYSYFPDKRLLFTEVTRQVCERTAEEQFDGTLEQDPRGYLMRAGYHVVDLLLSDFSQKMFRICVAEGERFPDLGPRFFEGGPRVERDRMITYFKAALARGELHIEDLELAAEQWMALCRSGLFPRIIFRLGLEVTQADIDRVVLGAVDMFLARYGVPDRPQAQAVGS